MKKFRVYGNVKAGENDEQEVVLEIEVDPGTKFKDVQKKAAERMLAILQGCPSPHTYGIKRIEEIIVRFDG